LQTFIKKVLVNEESWGITSYGGEKAQWFDYSNGARIWITGLDKSSKILSAEHDIIYVNQSEEIELADWEMLTTRTTGRAGNMPYSQTIGDANPGGSQNWILKRKGLQLYKSLHVDNPVLYEDGKLTTQGETTIRRLKRLTGVRRKRLYEGLWVTAEGAVYDMFDSQTHVIERNKDEFVRWYLAMDEGYTNPAVILKVGEDNDGRWHIAEEWYETGKLQEQVVAQTAKMGGRDNVNLIAVDAAAAGLIASLINAGMPANAAKGRVLDGIWHIQDRLKIQDDGKPRLTVDPVCLNTINEFESYIWEAGKDKPKKANDHAMDAIRYLDDIVGTPIRIFV
jgi:phage terminase large subunit